MEMEINRKVAESTGSLINAMQSIRDNGGHFMGKGGSSAGVGGQRGFHFRT